MNHADFAVGLVALAGMAVLSAAPAEAKIRCQKGYQNVAGSMLATPYCQDNYVGQVAREYGIKVTDAAIRNNPNVKRDVCRLIGRDNRVYLACVDVNSAGRRAY